MAKKVEKTDKEEKKAKPAKVKEEPKKEKPRQEVIEQKKVAKEKPQAAPKKQGKWYVVHTYAGHENKAAQALQQRIDAMKLNNKIFEIVVPTRNIVVVRHGKKEDTKEKIFPGYILVRMLLDDTSWLAVRTAPGVTAFVGAGTKPIPISDKEVEAIVKFMELEAPRFKTKFSQGEAVKIIDGPFADFLGTIDSIDEQRGKLKVLVSIFGRETPVELDFLQINKL